jgi:hypothetical protein
MNLGMGVYLVLLFVALTPGVLLSLPPGGSKLVVAGTHGAVFALVFCLTYRAVMNATKNM